MLQHLPPQLRLVEAGGDDGDTHLVAHVFVNDRAKDDVGIGVGRLADDLGRLVDLVEAQRRAAGDVEQDALGAVNGDVEQPRTDGLLGGDARPVFARAAADGHQRRAPGS